MESYGNSNLLFVNGGQFISYGGTSEVTAALSPLTIAVEVVATTDCWVLVGGAGETTPVAVKPGAESTRGASFPLRAGVEKVFPIPISTAGVKIAVIQDTSAGVLYVTERRE